MEREEIYFSQDTDLVLDLILEEQPPHSCYRAEFPISVLCGTHTRAEYRRIKERKIREGYRTLGYNLLEKRPILTTALPAIPEGEICSYACEVIPSLPYTIVLLDGHHRVRYGPLFGIRKFPAIVLTLNQTTYLYERLCNGDSIQMAKILERWMNDSLKSFGEKIPNMKPHPIVYLKEEDNGLLVPYIK